MRPEVFFRFGAIKITNGIWILVFCASLHPIPTHNQQWVCNFWTELLQWYPVSGKWSILPSDHTFQQLFVRAHNKENIKAQSIIKASKFGEHWRSVMQNRLEAWFSRDRKREINRDRFIFPSECKFDGDLFGSHLDSNRVIATKFFTWHVLSWHVQNVFAIWWSVIELH